MFDKKLKGWNLVYTDGWKTEMGLGAAASTGSQTESDSPSKVSSCYTPSDKHSKNKK